MALGSFNEALIRSASLDQVKAWLAGDVGNDSLPSKPRIDEIDRLTIDNEDTTSGVPLQVTSTVTTGGPVVDISAATLTTATALDLSNLDAITTGKAIHVDATGITQTTGILVHIDSASTALTGAGRLFLVDATGDFNDATGIAAEFKSVHTTGVGLLFTYDAVTDGFGIDMTIDALTSGEALRIVSSSTSITTNGRLAHFHASGDFDDAGGAVLEVESAHTTGVGVLLTMDAVTDGYGLDATIDALTTGVGVRLVSAATAITGAGRIFQVYHSGATSSSGIMAEFLSDATDETALLQLKSGGTGNDLHIVNTNTGALGPKIETYHNVGNSAAADDDVVFRLRAQADDEEASATKRQVMSLDVQWTDATGASYGSDLELYLAVSAASNLALTLSGGGQMGLDLDSDLSASSAAGEIFDDYDDALVLQRYAYLSEDVENRRATLLELETMGIVSRKEANRNGYMLNLQPMLKLLCGGVYQTREFMENHVERLNREIETLKVEIQKLKKAA